MKTSYNRTTFIKDLEKATVKIYSTELPKWESEELGNLVEYTGLASWDIIEGGEEALEIEEQGLVDEEHAYLVLHFTDGTDATFRNSHTVMFLR